MQKRLSMRSHQKSERTNRERAKMETFIVIYRYGKRIFREEYQCTDFAMQNVRQEIAESVEPPDHIRIFKNGKEVSRHEFNRS